MYFRVSTDGGYTWSEPIVYGTEQAAYLQALKAQQWAENPEGVEVETGQYSALHHKEKALDAQVAAEAARTGAEIAEGNALASENKAKQWAENPENVEVETGQYSALHHAAQSAESANNAATSASNAATSESNAATSEANALASENKAKQWAENPEDIEVVAGQYSALHHKEKAIDAQIAAEAAQSAAATSEANAAVSESNAATSATNAATSETNALASENKAHQWAEEAEDVEVETGEYSAYHWAQKAASFAPLIEDQIVDGVTTKTASQNAIYDALVMLERKVGGGILI
jgi:hypothetical protein